MKQYAIYIRVSTQKQGRSGLGLESQKKICEDFIHSESGNKIAEFMDVESGTHRDRRGLREAITFCQANKCCLVIAKLDRLCRDVEFCFRVVNTGIDIHFCDMPTINTLLLGVFASVAQYERELTSDRTKKALAVKKAYALGQIQPGVPVWRTGEESTFPGTPYVIFPGNVGDEETLKAAVEVLMAK
jgi:DNA invertase Pin-like site-specific DNA recombinase